MSAKKIWYLKNLQRRVCFLHISLVRDSSGGCSTPVTIIRSLTLRHCLLSSTRHPSLYPVIWTIPAALRRPYHGHLEGELWWQPERGQARKRTILAIWKNGVSLSQMQCRLHLQENAEDPHEVRLREGAEIQMPLLQQKGQVLVEYLQAY